MASSNKGMSAFHSRPADKDGSGYISESAGTTSHSKGVGGKYHSRPGSTKGTELSVVTVKGTGMCKGG